MIAQGTPDEVAAQPAIADRPVPVGQDADRDAVAPRRARLGAVGADRPRAAAAEDQEAEEGRRRAGAAVAAREDAGWLRIRGARGNNLKNVDRRHPGRPAHLRHRRVGLGQVDAGQRHALHAAVARSCTAATPSPRRTTRSRASTASTRSSTSTRARSAARRARTRRRTPACSRRSARCSPRCRRRASAATGRGASRSTSRAAAARAARATACSRSRCTSCPTSTCPCDVCHGKRYNRETLEVLYKGKNITEVLDLTVEDALEFFNARARTSRASCRRCSTSASATSRSGQSATTLSGGEAQRVKLALELSQARHRPHALHPRRADHRPALRRHRSCC